METCHVCGVNQKNIRQCGGCLSILYCSDECQIEDWHKGGHKVVCRFTTTKDTATKTPPMDWGKHLQIYLTAMETHAKNMEIPSNPRRQRNKIQETALKETKEIFYAMLKAKGGSSSQMDHIENTMQKYQEMSERFFDDTLNGNLMDPSSIINMQKMQDVAQRTVDFIVGRVPDTKEDLEKQNKVVYEALDVALMEESGIFIAEALLAREKVGGNNDTVEIEGDIYSWLRGARENLFGMAAGGAGNFLRNLAYCLGTTPYRTYSARMRNLAGDEHAMKVEHDKAMEIVKTHPQYPTTILIKAAAWIEEAGDIYFRSVGLSGKASTEAEKAYESKMQAATLAIAAVTAFALGYFTTVGWTSRGDKKKELQADLNKLTTLKDQRDADEKRLKILSDHHEAEEKKAKALAENHSELIRQNMQRQLVLKENEARVFKALVEENLRLETGCSLEEGRGLEAPQVSALFSSDTKNAIVSMMIADRAANQDTGSVGTYTRLPKEALFNLPTKECDPSEVMKYYRRIADAMFAKASSMNKVPCIGDLKADIQTTLDIAVAGDDAKFKIWKEGWESYFNHINDKSWTKNHPQQAADHLELLVQRDSRLASGAIEHVQEGFRKEAQVLSDEHQQYNMMLAEAQALLDSTKSQYSDPKNATNAMNLRLIAQTDLDTKQDELNEFYERSKELYPADPINMHLGYFTQALKWVYTLGGDAGRSFAGAWIPGIEAAYEGFISGIPKAVIGKTWVAWITDWKTFFSNAMQLLFYLNGFMLCVNMFGTSVLLLSIPVLVLIRKLWQKVVMAFTTQKPPENFKRYNTKTSVWSEGSGKQAGLIATLVGLGGHAISAGWGGIIMGVMYGSGSVLSAIMTGTIVSHVFLTLAQAVMTFWDSPGLGSLFSNGLEALTAGLITYKTLVEVIDRRILIRWNCLQTFLSTASVATAVTPIFLPYGISLPAGVFLIYMGQWYLRKFTMNVSE